MRSVLTYLSQSKPPKKCWIVVERSEMTFISIHIIANQNSCHVDKSAQQCLTRVICPQLIRNVRTRRRMNSSSIIAHPVNFAIPLYTGEKYETKISIYVSIYIYRYNPFDNHMDFAISIGNTKSCSYIIWFSVFKEVFQKLADL